MIFIHNFFGHSDLFSENPENSHQAFPPYGKILTAIFGLRDPQSDEYPRAKVQDRSLAVRPSDAYAAPFGLGYCPSSSTLRNPALRDYSAHFGLAPERQTFLVSLRGQKALGASQLPLSAA